MGTAVARHRRGSVFSQSSSPGVGATLGRMLLMLILLTVLAGAVFLGFWDVQPPVESIEIVIPNERFLR